MALTGFQKVFGVWFRQLDRFDPASFEHIFWHWPKDVMVPISSVLTLRKEKVDRKIFSFGDLQPITIHFGGSIDRRQVDQGRDYTMDLFFAHPGDVVVAKIDLKNGAVGLVPDWENVVVTNHFAIYEPDRSKLVPEYFLRLIQTSFFKAYLWHNKVGAEGRKEVKLEFFENIEIPLPPMEVQRTIVARWQAAQKSAKQTKEQVQQLEESIVEDVLEEMGINLTPLRKRAKVFSLNWSGLERWGVEFNRWDWTLDNLLLCSKFPTEILSNVADINPSSSVTLKPQDKITFVPMAAVSDEHGTIEMPEEKAFSEVRNGYTRFKENEVIWAKITPCMENGKCAVAKNLVNNVGFGSTEFHVVRTKNEQGLSTEYLWVLLRLSHIRQAAKRFFIGSAGQQRVPADFLENLRIPLPPINIQRSIVQNVLSSRAEIARQRERAAHIRKEAEAEVEALILGTQTSEV
ncbi:MAG: restriction endonuclease subunit S [Chloroflexota bacterium]